MIIFSSCPPSCSIVLANNSWVNGLGVVIPFSLLSMAKASAIPITIGKLRSPSRSFRTIICWSIVSDMMIFAKSTLTCILIFQYFYFLCFCFLFSVFLCICLS